MLLLSTAAVFALDPWAGVQVGLGWARAELDMGPAARVTAGSPVRGRVGVRVGVDLARHGGQVTLEDPALASELSVVTLWRQGAVAPGLEIALLPSDQPVRPFAWASPLVVFQHVEQDARLSGEPAGLWVESGVAIGWQVGVGLAVAAGPGAVVLDAELSAVDQATELAGEDRFLRTGVALGYRVNP